MKTQHYFAPGTITHCHIGKKPPYWWLLGAVVAAIVIVGALL